MRDVIIACDFKNQEELFKFLEPFKGENPYLKIGMELKGTVRNVIDFGAFVDIGVKYDGLVHISEMSDKYIKNPSELVSVGDIVKVKVIKIDMERKKVGLSMKV